LTGRLPVVVALVGILGVAEGCITVSGTSSGEMKRAVLNSFLFRQADVFYPNGVPEDPASVHPDLPPAQVERIRDDYERVLDTLRAHHARRVETLARLFDAPLSPVLRASMTVTNTGEPVAQIQSNGVLSLDVRVAQAIFRTALLTGFRERDGFALGGVRRLPAPGAEGTRSEQDLIRSFLEYKRRVEAAPAHTAFGDAFSGLGTLFSDRDLNDDRPLSDWHGMVDLATMSSRVERRYLGTLFFLLGHELGHIALRHHVVAEPSCEVLQRQEMEADVYGAALVSDATRSEALVPDIFFGSISQGYEDFFTHTYELSGFGRVATGERCGYPDPAARRQAVETVVRRVRERQLEEIVDGIKRDALDTPRR
jgi:hypothetical protein